MGAPTGQYKKFLMYSYINEHQSSRISLINSIYTGAPTIAFDKIEFPNEWQRFVNSENDGWGSRDIFNKYLYQLGHP